MLSNKNHITKKVFTYYSFIHIMLFNHVLLCPIQVHPGQKTNKCVRVYSIQW